MNLMDPMNHKIASLANQSIAYWANSMVKFFWHSVVEESEIRRSSNPGGVQKCICVKAQVPGGELRMFLCPLISYTQNVPSKITKQYQL